MGDIAARIRAIMTSPRTEWFVVAREQGAAPLVRYVALLALIAPLARFVGEALVGGYVPALTALTRAGLGYGLALVTLVAVALLVDRLAPAFGGVGSFGRALRLAAYSFTPAWIAGVFLIVPGASFLALLGLYGGYLAWLGLPALMRVPQERAAGCAAAAAAMALALDIAARLALGALVPAR